MFFGTLGQDTNRREDGTAAWIVAIGGTMIWGVTMLVLARRRLPQRRRRR